jgi:phosphatidylglycerol:prolipoprotein diacylglycerol transferase
MYGLLIATGVLLSIHLAEKIAKTKNLASALIWRVAFKSVLLGVIGARIYHVIDFWELYSHNILGAFYVWNGGLGIIGGILGGILGIYLTTPKKYFLIILDIVSTVIPLGQAIGRWGNYFNGELIPYAIYESVCNLVIFCFLYWKMKKPHAEGQIFSSYLVLYGLVRLGLDGFHNSRWFVGNFNITQILAILMMLAGLALLWKTKKQKN